MTEAQAARLIALLESIDQRLERLTLIAWTDKDGEQHDALRVAVHGEVEVTGAVTAYDPR